MSFLRKNTFLRIFLYIHKIFIRVGIHILPVYYYSPVPNIVELKKTKNIWARKSELPGISVNLDEQVQNLRAICLPYQSEYTGNRFYKEALSKGFGLGYGYLEAQALHGVIRYYKPKKIIEVGSGVSTYCMLAALAMNENETGESSQLTCIDPHPSYRLRALKRITLLTKKVQTLPLDTFKELGKGDLLFIDSSHTVKPGSDVNYLILEVLPCLRDRVIVHFHDIYLPYDYERAVLKKFFHRTETSLLRAFLIFNERIDIIFCMSQLHYDRKNELKEIFNEYDPQVDNDGLEDDDYKPFDPILQHFPASIYFQIQHLTKK
jgi:predicted O-methyltransferase YrrM